MNHNLGDGSWTLTVFVTDLQVERSLRVRGDLHIGGVMIRLVDELGKNHFLNISKNGESSGIEVYKHRRIEF